MAKSLDEILAEMQAVCDAATSGPWLSGYPNAGVIHELPGEIWNAEKDMICEYVPQIEDREFIAMSREALPRLIEAINYLLPKYVDLAFAHDEFTIEESHEAIKSVKSRMSEILQGRG